MPVRTSVLRAIIVLDGKVWYVCVKCRSKDTTGETRVNLKKLI